MATSSSISKILTSIKKFPGGITTVDWIKKLVQISKEKGLDDVDSIPLGRYTSSELLELGNSMMTQTVSGLPEEDVDKYWTMGKRVYEEIILRNDSDNLKAQFGNNILNFIKVQISGVRRMKLAEIILHNDATKNVEGVICNPDLAFSIYNYVFVETWDSLIRLLKTERKILGLQKLPWDEDPARLVEIVKMLKIRMKTEHNIKEIFVEVKREGKVAKIVDKNEISEIISALRNMRNAVAHCSWDTNGVVELIFESFDMQTSVKNIIKIKQEVIREMYEAFRCCSHEEVLKLIRQF